MSCRTKGADGCLGCHRQPGGRSFYVAGEPLDWAFHECRGKWCRDCYNCWRVQYSHTHPLALFGQWLKMSGNFKEWQVTLVAYMSLTFENCSQIRQDTLQKRITTIKWLANLFGFSLEPTAIFPLTMPSKTTAASSSDFATSGGQ